MSDIDTARDAWIARVLGLKVGASTPPTAAEAGGVRLSGSAEDDASFDPSDPRSDLHAIWQQGYDQGLAEPDRSHVLAGPFSPEAQYAFATGAEAGALAAPTSTPNPPPPIASAPPPDDAEPARMSSEPLSSEPAWSEPVASEPMSPAPADTEAAPEPVPPEPTSSEEVPYASIPITSDPPGQDAAPADELISYDPSSPDSPLHAAWQAGFDEAVAGPGLSHEAPSPFTAEGRDAYDAGVQAGLAEAQRRAAATPITPTDAPPEEVPATFEVGGLPAFRYNLPNIPINRATVPTPGGVLEIEFFLRGSVTVTFANAPPGISTDVNNQGWRVEAIKSLGPINAGIRVSGLGTDSPSIGAVVGTEFSNAELRFTPPNTMSFIGQAKFDYTVPTKGFGDAAVKGQAGFELKVTFTPAVPPPMPIRDPRSWLDVHGRELATVGLVVLVVVVAVAAAPETGGASLILLGV